ncbi:hypothetical protein U5640_16885 [Streptomyces sp. SS7]|uniref:hypothetical protein n=1 Tax=Streptomyces sp. SS7 TaxID=3108485 RepID=UPI0030ED3F66
MKHTHVAVGLVPDGLTNLGVVVEWTPGSEKYAMTLITAEGQALEGHDYYATGKDPIGYTPDDAELDMLVYRGLVSIVPLPARFVRSLAGFAYFKWWAPVDMPNKERAKFGAAE